MSTLWWNLADWIDRIEQTNKPKVSKIKRAAADLFFIEVSPGVTKTHVGKPSNYSVTNSTPYHLFA
jgi:hypothetical protein